MILPSIRRSAACLAAVLSLLASSKTLAASAPNDTIFNRVIKQAREAAALPFQPDESRLPGTLRQLDYDSYRKITFRDERALWHDANEPFEVQFFHPGYLFDHPVRINEVVAGKVRPVPFSTRYFRYPDFDSRLLENERALGFAGFRVLYPLNRRGKFDEVISFLGSNYFRALGRGQTYGVSARGLAINTGENRAEEFPDFREFWLCRPAPNEKQMQFFALLDGPSVAGAYRFTIRPGADTVVEVEMHLFFRRAVGALGLAPLTSMFWRGEKDSLPPNDKRPEVHDSDGLLIGKSQWLPLHSVTQPTTEVFAQTEATAFALLQRDRDPAHYRDREAHYEKRPSLRVEPIGDWGAGAVVLFQLPVNNEYNDNVVAFWQPKTLPKAGDALTRSYRLHWFMRESNKD